MARSRRKKGNPLLAKIVVATLAAHAVALPILAHFGAFKEIQKQFGTSRVVMVTMPPLEKEKPAQKTEKKPKTATKKAAGGTPKSTSAQRSNVPQPKVVASAATPGDGGTGGGPTVDANGSGKAGALPSGAGGPANASPTPIEKTPPPETKPEPKVETPAPKPAEPTPKPPAVVPPVTKPEPAPRRIVQAEAIESPQPTIPDELRTEPFEKTLVVEADIDTGGRPTNVRVAEGTGVKALDDAGLDAARRYRFKAATVNDAPVEQHVRFRIVFKVE